MKNHKTTLKRARDAMRANKGPARWQAIAGILTTSDEYGAADLGYLTERAPGCTPAQYLETLATLGTWDAAIMYEHGPRDARATGETYTLQISDLFARDLRAADCINEIADHWDLRDIGDGADLDDHDLQPVIAALVRQLQHATGDHDAARAYDLDIRADARRACADAIGIRIAGQIEDLAFDVLARFLRHMAPDAGITVHGYPGQQGPGSVWEATRIDLHYTARRCAEIAREYEHGDDPGYWSDALHDLASDGPRITSHAVDRITGHAYYWAADDLPEALFLIGEGWETSADQLHSSARSWRARLPGLIRGRVDLATRERIRREILGIEPTGKHDGGPRA